MMSREGRQYVESAPRQAVWPGLCLTVVAIKELTSGGVDYAFDTIGVRATTEQILAATRPGWVGRDAAVA